MVYNLFTLNENHTILDGDQYNRRESVEKCAIASKGLGNAFAVRQRLCYIANITLERDYITDSGTRYECAMHGRVGGNAFDIYRYSNGKMKDDQHSHSTLN